MKHIFKSSLQMFLLVVSIFAFAYIIKDIDSNEIYIRVEKKGLWLNIFKLFVKAVFNERTLVSALEPTDLKEGVATCPKGKDNSICQEYPVSECKSKCAVDCIPSTRDNTPGCKRGTCFDPKIGTCQEGATQNECGSKGGKWLDNNAGNVAECQKACCIVGSSVRPLRTSTECKYIKDTEGIETEFRPDLKNELACLALSEKKDEGACLFNSENERACLFITNEECISRSGEFHNGLLCTAPELGMNYKKQETAKCDDDKLYWFDSNGNKENIYDSNKAKSWNNGKILPEEESCKIGTDKEKLENQKTCGNCNRFLGTICGPKTSEEKLSDNSISSVCRDMRCKDKNGNIRQNGENWCEYQGDIGVEKGAGGFDRSVDTPGSSHFRVSCIDGEVKANRCGDGYRNSVCIEEKNKREDGAEVSNSACVTNLWQLCLSYNSEVKGESEERTRSLEERDKKCTENPHCLLKKVDIANNFKFNLCVPRYSPGFDLQKNAEGGELSCAFANQKCTVVKVKEIGGWKTKVNKGCLEPKFAEQLNDLCMSLGDCGAEVNYMGELTENYNVYESPKLSENYLSTLKKYSETVKGKYIPAGNITAYLDAIGAAEVFMGKFRDPSQGLDKAGMISGAVGGLIVMIGPSAIGKFIGSVAWSSFGASYGSAVGISSIVTAASGALAGAAIGFAVTSLLIKYTGIGAGLDPAVTWSLIGAGTAAGAALGFAAAGGSSTIVPIIGIGWIPFVGWILVAIVVIFISVMAALGIGKMKKINVEFQCKPWQPPLGGKRCGECGSDGYDCSKYSCQALGQTCRLINEGTGEEKCVDISPNDVTSPVISPLNEVLSPGFKYKDATERGVKIASDENDGCLRAYQPLVFGIKLNEPGYCRFNTKHTNNFDEMSDNEGGDFGFRNLFLENHTHLLQIPDLTSLGADKYDPLKKVDFNFYIRCLDGNGNGKDSTEYQINMCVKPGEDKTEPIITVREPLSEFVKFTETKLSGAVYTNEPSQCKWDLDKNKKYAEMKNEMSCENDIVDRNSLFGWRCNATFQVQKEENTFYIKCKDQPWYGDGWQGEGSDIIKANESKRNEMREAYAFVVKRTKTQLNISSVKPNGQTFLFGVEPATVILEVETSGGVDNTATCKLSGFNMGETFTNKHKQIFNQIYAGDYEFPIFCEDSAGNTATAVSKFKVEIDSLPPVVTRVYREGEKLTIITNEDSTCAYMKSEGKKKLCDFEFAEGTLMSGDEKIHTTALENLTYNIKCKDKYGKIADGCSIIVREKQ